MFGIGSTELLVIVVVAVLVLGPEHLPRVVRTLTKVMSDFRRISTEFQRAVNLELSEEELRQAKQAQKVAAESSGKKKKKKRPPPADAAPSDAAAAVQNTETTTIIAAETPAPAEAVAATEVSLSAVSAYPADCTDEETIKAFAEASSIPVQGGRA